MSDEKDKEQLKKEAAMRAKELALKKLAERKAQAASTASETLMTTDKSETPEKTEKVEKTENNELENNETDDLAKQKALAKAKAAAAAKAKVAALAKQQSADGAPPGDADDVKAKAIAAAKAKAAAAAKAKVAALAKQQSTEGAPPGDADDVKAKAIAAAKAKAAAAAKAKVAALAKQQSTEGAPPGDGTDDLAATKAKAIAAAKAKAAAAAAAKAKAAGGASPEEPAIEEKPKANQVYLDKYVKVIAEHLGIDVLEESYLNPLSKDVPTLVAKLDTYFKVAEFLKFNEQLGFDYLSEIHGSDFETHMEIYVHLFSFKNRQSVALKVKIDRDVPVIDSIQPLWEGANWPEREAYDLLGITFKNHPKLERILLPDDWIGYPLRKDYEPYDVEV